MNETGSNKVIYVYLFLISMVVYLAATIGVEPIWATIGDLPLGNTVVLLAKMFFAIHAAVFIWRIVLCLQYKPAAPCSDTHLPKVTVIVPAYNEGRQAFDTIESIVKSDYPAEKMTIVGVDDGSVDNTWTWLQKAAVAFPRRVKLFRQPKNRGKRHALYRGFKYGKGDVFVTIDSDSNVEPQTLRHLVSAFVHDSKVGAVAGNVRILNRDEGIIPKMLEVSFAYSFDFLRAGQSVINSVMCTPGALSAYRSEVVKQVLPIWIDQRFCGRPANIGEDRAMTNLILKSGYRVHYQKDAVVYTTAPITLSKLWKMLLRWARSNVRETLVISKFVFGKFRQEGAIGLRINALLSIMNLTIGQIMRLASVVLLAYLPVVVGPKMVFGAAIASCAPGLFYAIRYRSNQAIWAIPYSYFWMTCLTWISTYALITPHKTGWMTRDMDNLGVSWASSSGKAPSFTPTP